MQNELKGFQLYLLLTAIALAAFLISLDGFIVNVAIPPISGELGVPGDIGTWIITLFSIASCACVPLSGALSSRFGNFRLFMFGIIAFGLASLFSGLAPNFQLLMIGRVLQGAAAGLLTPVSLALIINNFPAEKKGIAIGFWSFFVMVGPAMGPMIGGWLADYHWPWMFYLNIPVTLFSAVTVWVFLKHRLTEINYRPIDIVGIALLFTCVGTLQSATNRWNIDDWFRSPFIVALFIISALSLVFFIVWELFHHDPFIDIRLFKNRGFSLATVTTGVGMGMLFSSFVLDSLWVQAILGYTPAWAGLTLSPVGIFPLLMYPIMGRFVSIIDVRIWVIGSFVLYAATFFWLSHVTVYTAFWQLALPRLVQGIGFAMFTVPNAVIVVQGIKAEKLASVISLFSFVRIFCVGLSVALAVTLWIFRETFYQTRLTARTFPSNPFFNALRTPFERWTHSEAKGMALAYDAIQADASTLALADIYYLYCWLFLALCIIVFFYQPLKKT